VNTRATAAVTAIMLAGLSGPSVAIATGDAPDGSRLDDTAALVTNDAQADAATSQVVATNSDD
jgi:hypothetical protein